MNKFKSSVVLLSFLCIGSQVGFSSEQRVSSSKRISPMDLIYAEALLINTDDIITKTTLAAEQMGPVQIHHNCDRDTVTYDTNTATDLPIYNLLQLIKMDWNEMIITQLYDCLTKMPDERISEQKKDGNGRIEQTLKQEINNSLAFHKSEKAKRTENSLEKVQKLSDLLEYEIVPDSARIKDILFEISKYLRAEGRRDNIGINCCITTFYSLKNRVEVDHLNQILSRITTETLYAETYANMKNVGPVVIDYSTQVPACWGKPLFSSELSTLLNGNEYMIELFRKYITEIDNQAEEFAAKNNISVTELQTFNQQIHKVLDSQTDNLELLASANVEEIDGIFVLAEPRFFQYKQKICDLLSIIKTYSQANEMRDYNVLKACHDHHIPILKTAVKKGNMK